MRKRIESRLPRAQEQRVQALPLNLREVANPVQVVPAVPAATAATAATTRLTIVVTTAAMTTEVAIDGITVATIRAAADAMTAAHGAAVKAEDPGMTAIPVKVVAARMEMATEIVAIVLLLIIRLTPQSARAILIRAKTVAIAILTGIGTKTRIGTRIKTRTATEVVTRTETKTRIVTKIGTRTAIGIATGTETKTGIVIETEIVTKTRTKIRTRTGIAGAVETTGVTADTTAIPSTTTQLLTNLGTMTTMLMA